MSGTFDQRDRPQDGDRIATITTTPNGFLVVLRKLLLAPLNHSIKLDFVDNNHAASNPILDRCRGAGAPLGN